jgi:hypothetical protein
LPVVDDKNTRGKVLARLGNVVYWTACAVAVGCIFLSVLGFGVDLFHLIQDEPSKADNMFMLVFGVFVWVIGRVLRYALAGR